MFVLTAIAGADVKVVADGSDWASWSVDSAVDYGATVVLRQSHAECWPPGRATVISEQYRGVCDHLGVPSLSGRVVEWAL